MEFPIFTVGNLKAHTLSMLIRCMVYNMIKSFNNRNNDLLIMNGMFAF